MLSRLFKECFLYKRKQSNRRSLIDHYKSHILAIKIVQLHYKINKKTSTSACFYWRNSGAALEIILLNKTLCWRKHIHSVTPFGARNLRIKFLFKCRQNFIKKQINKKALTVLCSAKKHSRKWQEHSRSREKHLPAARVSSYTFFRALVTSLRLL